MSYGACPHSIFDLETICATLDNIMRRSFGPKSQFTLLSSSTGHVTLSSDGLTILTSLHLSHPIARAIVKSMESYVSLYGDGCKTMILYLASLMRALVKEFNKTCPTPLAREGETFFRGFFSRTMHSFLSVDLPEIVENMTRSIALETREAIASSDCDDIIFRVIKPIVEGTVPNGDCAVHVAKVLDNYLMNGCSTISDVQNRCRWFDNSLYLVPHQPFGSSCVINGILLSSRLFSNSNLLPLNDVKFICLQCPINGNAEDNDSSIFQLSSPEIFLGHGHAVFHRFLLYLKSLEISFIVSSSKMSDFCLQHCLESNFTVVDCVEETDLLWICSVYKKSPVCSTKDTIDAVNIFSASHCDKITFGQKSYVNLIINESCHLKSVFLCAPSQGICQQLKMKSKRSMKVITHLIDNVTPKQNESLNLTFNLKELNSNVITGQGFFETLLSDHIDSYCDKVDNPDIRLCCTLVRRMLMEIPKELSGKFCSHACFRESSGNSGILVDLLRKMSAVDRVQRYGHPLYPGNHRIIEMEVLSVKIALVYNTIGLVVKLLRMDNIIAVRGRLSDGSLDCISEDVEP